jgi:dihydrolipoamide dehydrogenase
VAVVEVDTVTIGAGGGAYPAAFLLARSGQRVVMVDDKGVMSGNCLAEGCVPSKAVREVAELYRRARLGAALGLPRLDGPPDYEAVLAHKARVQRLRYAQHAAELAAEAYLELVAGHARLVDAHTVEVEGPSGERTCYRARFVLLASGSDVTVPPGLPGAEHCVTSRDLYALEPTLRHLPRRLVVIGGGYIGLEAACLFHALGCDVVVVELADQLLPGMDPAFSELLTSLLDEGIGVRTGAAVERVDPVPAGLAVRFRTEAGEGTVEGDTVLLAVGRHPVVPEGAREAGIVVGEHGVLVDQGLRTSLPHVFAPGDVNGRSPLFHAAVRQSLVAATNVLAEGRVVETMDFDAVPTTVFTSPEAAVVGRTRTAAAQEGLELLESARPLADDARAQILDDRRGEVRLFFEARTRRVVGGWVVGVDAGNLIGEIGLAVASGLTADQLARFADQHPMASEEISGAARALR